MGTPNDATDWGVDHSHLSDNSEVRIASGLGHCYLAPQWLRYKQRPEGGIKRLRVPVCLVWQSHMLTIALGVSALQRSTR
jgi:hypothetical protein